MEIPHSSFPTVSTRPSNVVRDLTPVEKKTLAFFTVVSAMALPLIIATGIGIYWASNGCDDFHLVKDLVISLHVFGWIFVIVSIMIAYCYNIKLVVEYNRRATEKRNVDQTDAEISLVANSMVADGGNRISRTATQN